LVSSWTFNSLLYFFLMFLSVLKNFVFIGFCFCFSL
jgi:hypothetical protein